MQQKLAFFKQHHDGDRGDGFGHGVDVVDRIIAQRRLRRQVAIAPFFVINRAAILKDDGMRTCNLLLFDRSLIMVADALKAGAVEGQVFVFAKQRAKSHHQADGHSGNYNFCLIVHLTLPI